MVQGITLTELNNKTWEFNTAIARAKQIPITPGPEGPPGPQGDPANLEAWEDFQIPMTSTKQGANNKPDYDFTNVGYLFPNGDATEILYASGQLPHAVKLGTGMVMHPHIHVIQAAANVVVFKLDYRIIENGQTPGSFVSITSTGYHFTYTAGTIAQIVKFDPIVLPPSLTGLSALIDVKLRRDDVAYAGDMLVKSFDFHLLLDANGSEQEYTK